MCTRTPQHAKPGSSVPAEACSDPKVKGQITAWYTYWSQKDNNRNKYVKCKNVMLLAGLFDVCHADEVMIVTVIITITIFWTKIRQIDSNH